MVFRMRVQFPSKTLIGNYFIWCTSVCESIRYLEHMKSFRFEEQCSSKVGEFQNNFMPFLVKNVTFTKG